MMILWPQISDLRWRTRKGCGYQSYDYRLAAFWLPQISDLRGRTHKGCGYQTD